MPGQSKINLTALEALELLRTKRPAELSAEEIAAIRAKLGENPALFVGIGGQTAAEQYLQEAEASAAPRKAGAISNLPEEVVRAAPVKRHSRRAGRRFLALAGCLILLGGITYWQFGKREAPPVSPPVAEKNVLPRTRSEPNAAAGKPADIVTAQPPKDKLEPEAGGVDTWHSWKVQYEQGAEVGREWRWDLSDPTNAKAEECLRIGRQSVTLTTTEKWPVADSWLLMDVAQAHELARYGTFEIRIEGKVVARFDLPELKADSHYAVPLGKQPQDQARLEVVFAPHSQDELVVLHRLALVADPKFGDTKVTIVPPLEPSKQPRPAPPAANAIAYFPSPYPVFEDEGAFRTVEPNNGGAAEIVTDNVYSGTAAAKVKSSGAYRLDLAQPLTIAEVPRQNEFRYLRFAVRGSSGGRVVLEVNHRAADARVVRFDFGPGEPPDGFAFHVYDQSLPDGWILVTRDLFRDVGQVPVTGITISKLDGGEARLDHVYLARTLDQFDNATAPSAQALAKIDETTAIRLASDTPERAIVSLDLGNRVATGTIVSEDGFILTAAHLIAGPTEKIVAHFSDGTQCPCKLVSYRRDFNLGVVKLSGRPRYWPYLPMAAASMFGDKRHYRAFAYRYINYKPEDKPLAIHVPEHVPFAGRANIGNVQWELACGGPVLEPSGTIVGINTGPDPRGGLGFLPIEYARDNWQQLSNGQPGGDWGQYQRPVLGLGYEAIPAAPGLKITSIDNNWPVAGAGLQVGDVIMKADGKQVTPFDLGIVVLKHEPGDTINLTIRRPGENEDREISFALGRRQ